MVEDDEATAGVSAGSGGVDDGCAPTGAGSPRPIRAPTSQTTTTSAVAEPPMASARRRQYTDGGCDSVLSVT